MKEGQLPQPLLAPTTQQGVFSGGGEGDEGQQGNEMQQLELYNMNLQVHIDTPSNTSQYTLCTP